MATGGGAGVVTVWDLEQRKLHTVIRDAHDAPIVQLHFFPGERLLEVDAAWLAGKLQGAAARCGAATGLVGCRCWPV